MKVMDLKEGYEKERKLWKLKMVMKIKEGYENKEVIKMKEG